jgi:hypothetical protein
MKGKNGDGIFNKIIALECRAWCINILMNVAMSFLLSAVGYSKGTHQYD